MIPAERTTPVQLSPRAAQQLATRCQRCGAAPAEVLRQDVRVLRHTLAQRGRDTERRSRVEAALARCSASRSTDLVAAVGWAQGRVTLDLTPVGQDILRVLHQDTTNGSYPVGAVREPPTRRAPAAGCGMRDRVLGTERHASLGPAFKSGQTMRSDGYALHQDATNGSYPVGAVREPPTRRTPAAGCGMRNRRACVLSTENRCMET